MSRFLSKLGKRKRPISKPFSDLPSSCNNMQARDDENPPGPLKGVIACLSGLAQGEKEDLHRLILKLGGRYSRELNLDLNTHLITDQPKGAKFELASSSNPQIVEIVTPSWLIATSESGQRALEIDHRLRSTINGSEKNHTVPRRGLVFLANDVLDEAYGTDTNLSRSFLFQKLQFYLIGFEGNPELRQKIGKIVRRGGGTIHWDLNGEVSILLLCNTSDDVLQKAAKVIVKHHFNCPPMVSPLWAIESYKKSALQPFSSYPPIEEKSTQPSQMKSTLTESESLQKTSLSSTISNVSIFRGCLFLLLRSSTLTKHAGSNSNAGIDPKQIDFDPKQIEQLIKAHGGQMLSTTLLDALRVDNQKTNRFAKRKCHIVCWGECPPRLETDPLASALGRDNLCEIIFVTPIWIQACVSVKKRFMPERMPLALQPQSWSMKSAGDIVPTRAHRVEGSGTSKHPGRGNQRLEIALTGFQGTEKVVIVHLIEAIGGVYHANMSHASTHLVFKKNPTGVKLEKAMEWGLHIVSIEWLYHILRYGYGGVHKDEQGCEKRYSFDAGP